ncbi:uncharacterized protein LOC133907253 [Phragmites australis]|uniref:uncharacterized protein LOC133907253 n=1 Tax=Phragmites australis TaxID=29695 RepID=UPI002D794C06|nr:uncharacterized protein LOC133907253 [Phragmites australis]
MDDHVDAAPTATPDVQWWCLDVIVLQWIHNSISADVLETVMPNKEDPTAADVWAAIDSLFRNNMESRALYLEVEFKNFVQGDMTISYYCQKMKTMADALADVGQPVTDKALVLNLLLGLNEQFAHLWPIFGMQSPYPTFINVRTTLLLEEIQKNADTSRATMLISGHLRAQGLGTEQPGQLWHARCTASVPARPILRRLFGSTSNNRRNSNNNQRNSENRSGYGNNAGQCDGGNRDSGNRGAPPQWPTMYNPWTSSFQVWSGAAPGQPGQGLLRPCPPMQMRQQALAMQHVVPPLPPMPVPQPGVVPGWST